MLTELQEKFLELYKLNAGNVSITAQKLSIDRTTYYYWYNKEKTDADGNPVANEFKEKIDEIKESLIDFSESMLFKTIKGHTTTTRKTKQVYDRFADKGSKLVTLEETTVIEHAPDVRAIELFLKAKAQSRGYGNKLELDYNEHTTTPPLSEKAVKLSQDLFDELKKGYNKDSKLDGVTND